MAKAAKPIRATGGKKAVGKRVFDGDSVSTKICRDYGDIIESGNKVLKEIKDYKVLSFSPSLDLALGGGLREGTCVGISGPPKTGKTVSSLHFAAKCQKLGKKIVYINTEGRLVKENFDGIQGLDPEKMLIIQATQEQPLVSAEMYLNALEAHIKGTPNLVAIVDSTSSMLPQEELEGEIRTGIRAGLPKLLALFFKRIAGDVARNKAIVIFITHNITNTAPSGPFSPKMVADSGTALQYQVSTNMVITHKGAWEVPKESGNHVGQIVYWVVKTTAAGGIPNSTAESWIRYGIGIDEVQEVAQIALDFNLIQGSGWYEITAAIEGRHEKEIAKFIKSKDIDVDDVESVTKLFKHQGMANLTDFINENNFLVGFLDRKIKEMMA